MLLRSVYIEIFNLKFRKNKPRQSWSRTKTQSMMKSPKFNFSQSKNLPTKWLKKKYSRDRVSKRLRKIMLARELAIFKDETSKIATNKMKTPRR